MNRPNKIEVVCLFGFFNVHDNAKFVIKIMQNAMQNSFLRRCKTHTCTPPRLKDLFVCLVARRLYCMQVSSRRTVNPKNDRYTLTHLGRVKGTDARYREATLSKTFFCPKEFASLGSTLWTGPEVISILPSLHSVRDSRIKGKTYTRLSCTIGIGLWPLSSIIN